MNRLIKILITIFSLGIAGSIGALVYLWLFGLGTELNFSSFIAVELFLASVILAFISCLAGISVALLYSVMRDIQKGQAELPKRIAEELRRLSGK